MGKSTGAVKKRGKTEITGSVRRFRDLTQAFFDKTFQRFPEQGSATGLHEFDHELGRLDPSAWERQNKLVLVTLAEIEALPLTDFSPADQLDRRAMLAHLRSHRFNHVTLGRWRNNPQIHLHEAADAIYNLVVRHADDLTPVATAVLSRLKQVPRYYDQAAECIKAPDPLWQRLTQQAAPSIGELYRSLTDPLIKATGKHRASIEKITQAAADAAQAYAKRIARLKAAPTGSFALGEERLTARIREQLGLDWSPAEARAVGLAEAARLGEAMRREARRFGTSKTPHEILEAARQAWRPEGDDLLTAYARTTERIRERFREEGMLTLPEGETLLIKRVPDFMKDLIPTAAYSSPGPLDPDQTGIFWVNDLRAREGSDKQRRAETAQHFGLELTCAHEAYPGHHVQFILQNRLPSLPRKLANHAVYYEGWTLWCEELTAKLNFPENPYIRLLQLHDELWRAWRIVIDVGLQTGTLTYKTASEVLMREVGFTRGRAEAEINWYSSSPTIPMSYLIGKLELKRLKRRRVDSGEMKLDEFNDWVLSFGAIPWPWIEQSGL